MHSTLAAAFRPDGFTTHAASPRPARRVAAFAIDLSVVMVLAVVVIMLPPDPGTATHGAVLYAILPYVPAAYLLLRDAVGGRSIGKLVMGLVVWDERASRAAGLTGSVIRNAPLAMLLVPIGSPLLPGLPWSIYLMKLAAAMLCAAMLWQIARGRSQRILERAARTIVIEARRR